MTEDSLLLIESRLGITLPASYRALHLEHADQLQELDWAGDGINPLYLTVEHVIAPNIEERQPEMGTACSFPNWWKSFFMIGTNGGGDYYSLRLDNTEGVWLIGSDCDITPTRVADSLLRYVEQTIAENKVSKALKLERIRRRAPFQKEVDAHLAEVARNIDRLVPVAPEWRSAGSPLAEAWMTCDAIYPMFEWLRQLDPKVSPRKLRLYGLAVCRLLPGAQHDTECEAGIALAKAMTLGTANEPDVERMRIRLRNSIGHLMANHSSLDPETYGKTLWRTNAVYNLFHEDSAYLSDAPIYRNDPDLTKVHEAVGYVVAGYPYGVGQAPDLLREVLGNPFLPSPILPQWRTSEVVNLAQRIFSEERFDRLLELASMLAKEGCTDERIFAHCQRPNDHIRGCWVVDAILGNL